MRFAAVISCIDPQANRGVDKMTKEQRLEEAIQKLKQQIFEIGAMRPGSLSQQTRKSKEQYGSYWHLSYTHDGKGHTHYVRSAFVKQLKLETANFARYKKLTDRLIGLSIELSQLRIKQAILAEDESKSKP
jgi:hypothetical protein